MIKRITKTPKMMKRNKNLGTTVRDRMFMNDIKNQEIANKNYEEEEVEEKLQKLMDLLDNFLDGDSTRYEKLKNDLVAICDFDHNYTFITVLRNKMNNQIFDMLIQIVHKTINSFQEIFKAEADNQNQNSNKNDIKFQEESVNLLLKTLKIIFLIYPKLIHGLNDLNLLFSQVFWLFKQEKTSQKRQKLCIDLMEFFIEGSNFYFNLINIKDIRDFIESADYSQLAHFTKVLALLVLDVKKPSQYEESIIINNHQVLLSIGNFIVKTIDICFFLTRITTNISNCQNKIELEELLKNLEQSRAIELSNFDITPFQQICLKSDAESNFN